MFGMAAVEAEPEAVFGGLALVEANQKPRQYYCPLGCETGDERLGGRLDSARGPDLKIVRTEMFSSLGHFLGHGASQCDAK